MMSQIVMSMSGLLGPFSLISFLETFAPSVEMYRSSNWSWVKRRIRQVLPTAPSPTRQIFTFIFWRSISILWSGVTRAPASGYNIVAQQLSSRITAGFSPGLRPSESRFAAVADRVGERLERLVHSRAGLRRREEMGAVVDLPHPRELFLGHDEAFGQVHLVPKEDEGEVNHLLSYHLHPGI